MEGESSRVQYDLERMMPEPTPSPSTITDYRRYSFRTSPDRRLSTLLDAEQFVKERGFLFFWPPKKIDFPSLWAAVAGERPVPNNNDDPAHITWRWKDSMLPDRRWYYGKLLRGRATLVSLEALPGFYALSPRHGDLDDFTEAYRAGNLTHEANGIARVLLEEGPQNSIQLRRKAGLSSPNAKSRFARGLTTLQKGLWILPIGVVDAGTWHYAFEYELLDRWLPEIKEGARWLTDQAARESLLQHAIEALGCTDVHALKLLFGWQNHQLIPSLQQLADSGNLHQVQDQRWCVPSLLKPR